MAARAAVKVLHVSVGSGPREQGMKKSGRMYLAMMLSALACMASSSEAEVTGSVTTTASTETRSMAKSTASAHVASAARGMTQAFQFCPAFSRAAATCFLRLLSSLPSTAARSVCWFMVTSAPSFLPAPLPMNRK